MSNFTFRRARPSSQRFLRIGLALALVSTTCLTSPALARNAWGGGAQVLSGNATITRSGRTLVIDLLTPDAVVAFPRFSVRTGRSVTIDELATNSIFVGEVLHGPAFILGTLTSNGQVVLIDPAGITVGPNASITTTGLILSTAGVSQASLTNFVGAATSGPLAFDVPGNPGARVANRGTIHVTGGAAFLAGETVENDGLIAAQLGEVVLAGAKTYTVDFTGDGMLKFAAITGAVDQVPAGTTSLVENSGTLDAPGGLVLMTAQTAKGILDNVINTSGLVEATAAQNIGGKIVLSAVGGAATVSGTLDASGRGTGETGGSVEVLGNQVTLAAGAWIDVSGDAGGGKAFVGGTFHGAESELQATATTVSTGAIITADALTSGDGGAIAVWSGGQTAFDGSASARGGAASGNGGSIETSGVQLSIGGGASIVTSAATGHAGTWLLDPGNVTIVSTTGTGIVTSAGPPELLQPAAGATDATIQNTVIETALNSGTSVVISTTNGGTPAAASGDITVAAPVAWTTSAGLTLSAAGSIAFGSSAATLSSSGGGAITLQAGAGSETGSVTVGAAITTKGPVTLASGGSSGLVTIGAPVTAGALSVTGASGIAIDAGVGTIQSSAGQTYSGAVTIAPGTTTLSDSNNGAITFAGTIDGAGTLVTSTGGATIFEGVVGGATALGDLSVAGPTVFDISDAATNAAGFSVRALSVQAFAGAVTLDTDTVLTAAGNGDFDFGGTIDAASPGGAGLTLNGNIVSIQAVGGTNPLSKFDLSGGFANISGSITTNGGGQNFGNSELEILGTVTFKDIGGGNIAFGTPTLSLFPIAASSGQLTVATSGKTIFGGTAEAFGNLIIPSTGGTTILAGVPIVTSGGDPLGIDASGSLFFGNPVLLANNSLVGGNSVSFGSTVDSMSSPASLTATGFFGGKGGVSFAGAVGGRTPLASLSVTGSTTLGAAVDTAGGGQNYGGPVTIAAGTTTLSDSANGAITFGGTIDGAGTLVVNTSGLTTFDGVVGATTPLDALWVEGPSLFDFSVSPGVSSVQTGGPGISAPSSPEPVAIDQNYVGPVTLATTVILDDTALGNIVFGNTVNGVSNSFGLITSGALAVTAGATRFENSVGLLSLTVRGASTFENSVTADSLTVQQVTLALSNGSTISTNNSQTYAGPVTLAADASLFAGGSIIFSGEIDGAHNLKIEGGADTEFELSSNVGTTIESSIGATVPLASLAVNDATQAKITFQGGSVQTTGAQTYGGPVQLAGNETFGASAGAIVFTAAVSGASLAATAGSVTLDGATVAGLSITGSEVLAGNYLVGAAAQTYTFPSPVIIDGGLGLEQPTVFGSTVTLATDSTVNAVGTVTFDGTIDGAHSLAISAGGTTIFGGAIGHTTPLASLTIINPAAPPASGGGSGTGGSGGVVTTFGGDGVSETFVLSTGEPGTLVLVDPPGMAVIAGGSIVTMGAQTYGGAVLIGSDTVLRAPVVTFTVTIDGAGPPASLAILGNAGFGAAVGGVTPLASLAVTGATALSANVTTSGGGQSYGGAVTLLANAALSDGGSGPIVFGSTIDGGHALTVSTAGEASFAGAIGGTTPLGSVSIRGARIALTGDITVQPGDDILLTILGTLAAAASIDPASIVEAAQSSDAWMTQSADGSAAVGFQGIFATLLQPTPPPLLTILPPPLFESATSGTITVTPSAPDHS